MAARHKSVETKYMEERDAVLRGLRGLDRRTFLKVLAASAGAVMAKSLMPPHTFQLVEVANAATDKGFATTGMAGQAAVHLRVHLGHASISAHAQPALRARGGQSGRGRQRARSAARLRAVRRRPGATRAARGARSRQANPRRAEGAGEDDGRRARLVLRPGRHVAGDVRAAATTRSTGRACTSWC